jgi:hypothetical protein
MPSAGALLQMGEEGRMFTALQSAMEIFRKAHQHKYNDGFNTVIGLIPLVLQTPKPQYSASLRNV